MYIVVLVLSLEVDGFHGIARLRFKGLKLDPAVITLMAEALKVSRDLMGQAQL